VVVNLPNRRFEKNIIRGFILCDAQFVTRERKQKLRYLFCFPLDFIYLCLAGEDRLYLGKENKNSVICFAFLSILSIFEAEINFWH